MYLVLADVPAAACSIIWMQSHLCAGLVIASRAGPLTMSILSCIGYAGPNLQNILYPPMGEHGVALNPVRHAAC